ncbi:hypothetical protein B4N89_44960 [Embleya scabrispora]|uniref:Uncharacterized protein n=1 Tax=Embleya scabrispora TaxID=159449 RepID=A0A1T3NIE1_9ACTN|nr:hypothetical protein [Embleya scabrispora]OPC76646.1 hypothetical protein B4N89_44960 [Embleya scabrispora]
MTNVEQAPEPEKAYVLAPAGDVGIGTRYLTNRQDVDAGADPVYAAVWATRYVCDSPPSNPWGHYVIRLADGSRVELTTQTTHPVHPEVRDADQPPGRGVWITNEPEDAGHAEWVTHARPAGVATTTRYAVGNHEYTLLEWSDADGAAYYVRRETDGERWYSPLLWSSTHAARTWYAIVEGYGW